MPVPVNIQYQLNRIETELTLLSRKNKRKRTKRISERENITNGNINGTENEDLEDLETEDRENQDCEIEDVQRKFKNIHEPFPAATTKR